METCETDIVVTSKTFHIRGSRTESLSAWIPAARRCSGDHAYLKQIDEIAYHLYQTETLSRRKSLEELQKVYSECTEPNWDGYDSLPLNSATIYDVELFLNQLPTVIPDPAISPESGGGVCLTWSNKPIGSLSILFSDNDTIYYSCRTEHERLKGSLQIPFDYEIPKSITRAFECLFPTTQGSFSFC